VALLMLIGTVIGASLLHGSPVSGQNSGLVSPNYTAGYWWYIVSRNLLVLGLHFCACMIGALVGRRHQQLPESWQRFQVLDRELPRWMARGALIYGLAATSLSLILQTIGLSIQLANLSAFTHLAPAELIGIVSLHAIAELVGLFLPFGLLLYATYREDLHRLELLVWQSLMISLPLVLAAGAIETWLTPHLIATVLH
jgi:hypothetical protein